MKTLLLVLGAVSLCLTACAKPSSVRPNVDAFLQPTLIEGKYASLIELMKDPSSANRDLLDFAGAAEDALKRSNDDKRGAAKVLRGDEK